MKLQELPLVNIQIQTDSMNPKILLDGMDITPSIVKVQCEVVQRDWPIITLSFAPRSLQIEGDMVVIRETKHKESLADCVQLAKVQVNSNVKTGLSNSVLLDGQEIANEILALEFTQNAACIPTIKLDIPEDPEKAIKVGQCFFPYELDCYYCRESREGVPFPFTHCP